MSTAPRATPPAEVDLSAALVRALLERQHPEFASLRIVRAAEGWDNVMFRLGDDLAVRMPRRQTGADVSTSELDWLPIVGAHWRFGAPIPIRIGSPGEGYPWRWSIVPWIPGVAALAEPLSAAGARDVGRALAQVHHPVPDYAPRNPFRSHPLGHRAERFDERIHALVGATGPRLDADSARNDFAHGAAQPPGALTWCHLDLHGNNVLTGGGRLAGIIDWGDSALGDPATDLGQAWYMLGSENFRQLCSAYADAGGVCDPLGVDLPRVRADAIAYAVFMASLEDPDYSASGWQALHDLGLAGPA